MKLVTRDGICFVIDLVWQKDNADNKISIRKIKQTFDFSLYARTNTIEPSYCFVPNSVEVSRLISNKTLLYSLTVFVLESLKEVFSGVIEDSFICFKVAENSFGVIFIYKGGVIANDGEIIGNIEEIKDFIVKNAYRYNVLVAHVLSDVDALLKNDFLSKNGIELVEHASFDENEQLSASEYYLWQQDDRFKKCLKKSSLRTLDLLQDEHKLIAKKAALIVILLAILFYCGVFLIKNFFPEKQIVNIIAAKPITLNSVDPIENKRGVEIRVLMNECFKSLKDLPKYLQIQKINCNLNNLTANISVIDYDHEKAVSYVKDLFPHGIVTTKESDNVYSIDVNDPLPLAKMPAPILKKDEVLERLRLEKMSLVHNMNLSFEKKVITESFAVMDPTQKSAGPMAPGYSTESRKSPVEIITIVSPYSPFYLNKNHVLDKINVYNISMAINPDHTATWVIKGEFNRD